MRNFATAYRSDSGEPETVPKTWIDNPAIFDGLYLSSRPKPSRAKRGPVENPAADAAHPTDSGKSGATTTKE